MSWAAAASIGGSVLEGAFGKSQADKQMGFQEDMSNTTYQRMMKDLKLAGLNPILAGKLGAPGTPPGASAPTPKYGETASKAIQMANIQADTDLKNSVAAGHNNANEISAIDAEFFKDNPNMRLLERAMQSGGAGAGVALQLQKAYRNWKIGKAAKTAQKLPKRKYKQSPRNPRARHYPK